MSRPASGPRRALDVLFEDPRVALALAGVYLVFGLWFLFTDYTLNDEGLCTHIYASWARHDLWPTLFFQKSKPVLSLLYLPASAGGYRATLAAHLALASLAIPLVAAVARKLDSSLPNVPAFVLALSPLYLLGGAAGVSNVDGVLGATLVLYLLVVRGRGLSAGLVLGALPWVRHELGVFVAAIGLHVLFVERSTRAVIGLLTFPAVYAAAGAIYHHDALWILHYPPTTWLPMPGNPVWAPFAWRQLLANLLAVSPVVALSLCVRPRRLTPLERTLLLYAAASLFFATVLPMGRIANFGFLPRYSLHVLPAVALLTARALEPWRAGERPGVAVLLAPALLVAIWGVGGGGDAPVVAPVLIGYGAVLLLAFLRRGAAAAAAAIAMVVVAPALPMRTQILAREVDPSVFEMTAWLRENRGSLGPVYTNSHLLAYHLEGAGHLPGVDLRYLVAVDMAFDFNELCDPHNGQREAIWRLTTIELYGHGVPPQALLPETVPEGALFLFRDSDQRRTDLLLTRERWGAHLSTVASGPHFHVMRFTR